MKTSRRIVAVAALLGGLTLTAQADVVVGGWQSSTAEGWIDWGNGLSITDPANAAKYSFASGAVSGYGQSLKITQDGWNQGLALKLEYTPGDMAAFFDNHLLSFTFSVPDAASVGSPTSGFSQLYAFTLNASGYGWHDIAWDSPMWSGNSGAMPNFYWWSSAPGRSMTVTLDYSSLLSSITATPTSGWVEMIFTSNTGGGAPSSFYMNNVELWGGPASVPEPSTLAMLGLGALGLLALRRKR